MNLRHWIFAKLYDRLLKKAEQDWLAEKRRELLAMASGRVIEIGGGTGANLPHYRDVQEVVLTEPHQEMMAEAGAKLSQAQVPVTLHKAPAESLPFADGAFDTAVATLVFCTVADLEKALFEIHRVLSPQGRLLFIEHIRGSGRRARWQDRLTPVWSFVALGCHLNRETVAAIERSGFRLEAVRYHEPDALPRISRPLVSGLAVKIAAAGELQS
ncbi:MAG: class I SAM-dependent methyltransferase [Acidobacteriota bacterium]